MVTYAAIKPSASWWRVVALLPVLAFIARPKSPPARAADRISRFSKSALLQRFDSNHNGCLERAERVALRRGFGGIDVPMLPDRLDEYTAVVPPTSVPASQLAEWDNTPADNPLTDAGATLGRVLFYDRQLSRSRTIACASCHLQARGFSDPRRFSVGYEGGHTRRNAMGLANLRYTRLAGASPGFFWDERAPTLEDQVLMPIQDSIEMGMTLDELESRLQALPYYPPLFQRAFGSPQVTRAGIAKSVAQFMRSMVAFDSKFDQAWSETGADELWKDFPSFTPEENLGKSLFIQGVGGVGEIGCAHCHRPPTFGMPKAFNNGLELQYADRGLGELERPPNDPFTPNNDGKFKAPSLRNIELTAPYMHDGRFGTLEEVIAHYSEGVHPHINLGLAFRDGPPERSRTSGFQLTQRQQAGLIAFLKTLTDRSLISDRRFADPFVRLSQPAP